MTQPGTARLPAGAHHGFIFAVIGEESGLLGLAVFLVLYTFIIGRALYLAVQTPTRSRACSQAASR